MVKYIYFDTNNIRICNEHDDGVNYCNCSINDAICYYCKDYKIDASAFEWCISFYGGDYHRIKPPTPKDLYRFINQSFRGIHNPFLN